jgi:multidrug efflux pump subunit AcrA (membrane-fusion protein)
MLVLITLALLLPWDQFSSGQGRVIGLDPNDRFQEVHAPVAGFVRRWHVNEGSWVKKGDPLVSLSDTDVDLVDRLSVELKAAEEALKAAELALETGRVNQERQRKLFEEGLAARKSWEQERINVSKLEMEVSKAQATVAKAQREVARQNTQTVISPRDAWVVRVKSGEGAQIVKLGDALLVLAPKTEKLAAEIWVDANDATLIKSGDRARLEFAGWPAVQIPGWPSLAIGTFGAQVTLVDAIASQKGKIRVLLIPTEPWPSELFVRQGARTSGFVRMSTVSLGWELWRQFNGMPAQGVEIEDEVRLLLEQKKSSTSSEKAP